MDRVPAKTEIGSLHRNLQVSIHFCQSIIIPYDPTQKSVDETRGLADKGGVNPMLTRHEGSHWYLVINNLFR